MQIGQGQKGLEARYIKLVDSTAHPPAFACIDPANHVIGSAARLDESISTWLISRSLASAAKLCGECPPATHGHLLCSSSP